MRIIFKLKEPDLVVIEHPEDYKSGWNICACPGDEFDGELSKTHREEPPVKKSDWYPYQLKKL